MKKDIEEILSNLLLQNNGDWRISEVVCDESAEEIHITLEYLWDKVVIDGREHPIHDYRELRDWRHLDLWQYKTILSARIPRYWDKGVVKSVEVPWALPHSRLSWLMEKKR